MLSGIGIVWKNKSELTDGAGGGEGGEGEGKGRERGVKGRVCVMMLTFGVGSVLVWCLGNWGQGGGGKRGKEEKKNAGGKIQWVW